MFTRPVWHVCDHDDSSHLAGPWCERASTSTSAAFAGELQTAPRAAGIASSHRTTSTATDWFARHADAIRDPSIPRSVPIGVSERFAR